MEKKVQDILEAFENHRFEDALRQIEQLIKKVAKDAKKKNALTDHDNRILQLVKCGCLANIGKIHEANQIIENFFTQKILVEVPEKEKLMLISISQMAFDDKIRNKIQVLNKNNKGDAKLERFMLTQRQFSSVSKSFLKQYATEKREEDGLAQIFLEYINELNKVEPIENYYSRDLILRPNKELNLKMVQLFFTKYFSSINLEKLQNIKLRSSIIDLRIRLAINSGRTNDAKKFYLEHFEFIRQHFVYLRSIRQITENQTENHRFYIENCGRIFRRNIQIEKYVPLYDFYDEFSDFLMSQNITKDLNQLWQILQKQELLSEDCLYSFKDIPNSMVLAHYFKSLNQQLKYLTAGQKHQSAKKSDYYKISIKGLMLQILKILFSVAQKIMPHEQAQKALFENKIFQRLIEIYFLEFGKTFTYCNEMKNYFPFVKDKFQKVLQFTISQKPKLKLPNTFSKPDDNLIFLTNTVKILIVLNIQKLKEWKQTQRWIHLCWSFYQEFIEEVEETKKRQKGEIFLSDQFMIILSDLIVYHLENLHNFDSVETQSFIESILLKVMALLDYATELSPFNGYLKLRLIYVCQKLNHFEKICETYASLDIKSVQFQTLGYFLTNPLNNFNLYSQSEERLVRMVRSYQENQRQTSEYCLKALKAGTTHQVFEYLSYQKRMQKSFSQMMVFYTFYLKYDKKEYSQFYLDWILKKLNQYREQQTKISFNADTKTMQNFILSLTSFEINQSQVAPYNEYYGYLNSPQVFELQVKTRKLQALFKTVFQSKFLDTQKAFDTLLTEAEEKLVNLSKTSSIANLFDISKNFHTINDYLRVTKITQKIEDLPFKTFTLSRIMKQFHFYLKIIKIKVTSFNSFKSILVLLKQTDNNQVFLSHVKQQFALIFEEIDLLSKQINQKLNWRQQVKICWPFRQALFSLNHVIKLINDEAGKTKKLPKSTRSLISQFAGDFQKTVIEKVTGIKFVENLKVNPSILELPIDKTYQKRIIERDDIIKRLSSMSQKEAKDFLIK